MNLYYYILHTNKYQSYAFIPNPISFASSPCTTPTFLTPDITMGLVNGKRKWHCILSVFIMICDRDLQVFYFTSCLLITGIQGFSFGLFQFQRSQVVFYREKVFYIIMPMIINTFLDPNSLRIRILVCTKYVFLLF